MRLSLSARGILAAASFLPATLAVAFGGVSDDGPSPNDRRVDYLREVRPILAQHCFQCHGPDGETRKAKLRFDEKEVAFSERKGKHVIAPGDPAGSLVMERITSENERKRMPPADKAEPLTPEKIETLRLWIEQGAPWPEHWAFMAPLRPEPPAVRDEAWVENEIDRFVLERLEKEGLSPSPRAEKEAQLRRLTFDLTGMPPTIADLDAFLADDSPEAWETQVDRLLASPRFGERQAQEWLDLARYADTSGYQRDEPRTAWKWREWVVEAFNANMPYDRFTVEQLAGDLLPNPSLAQRVATGFNRNNPTNSEAGEEEDEYRTAYVVDRVNTTATTFMGLTMACAQCHDHKYDPISQRDYYRFFGFFNHVKERDSDGFGRRNPRPSIPVPNPDQAPRLRDLEQRIAALKSRLEIEDPLADAAQREWEERMIESLDERYEWITLEPIGMLARNGSILQSLEDGSILSTGATPVRDTYDVVAKPGKRRIAALKLEVLPHESQPEKASGRSTDGRFILSRLEIRNSSISESADPPLVFLSLADADLRQEIDEDANFDEPQPGSIDGAIVTEAIPESLPDGEAGRFSGGGWSIVGDAMKEPHAALLVPREPLDLNEASVLRISLHHTSRQRYKSLIGRFRISYTEDARVRERMLPVLGLAWSTLGPFPAEDVVEAFQKDFGPEKDLAGGVDLKKTWEPPKIAVAEAPGGKPSASAEGGGPKEKESPADPAAEPKGPKQGPNQGPKQAAKQENGKKPADAAKDARAEAASSESVADAKPAASARPAAGEPQGDEAPAPAEKAVAKAEVPDAAPAKPPAEGAPAPKPAAEAVAAKPEAPAAEKDSEEAKPEEGQGRRGPKKDTKLAWVERDTWRDGSAQRLDGQNVAHYLSRKVVAHGARTATLRLDGPAGYRVWLNGESIATKVPDPPKPPPKKEEAKEPKKEGADAPAEDNGGEDDFDFFEMIRGRGRGDGPKIRIGLRDGENEIVVKIVNGAAAAPSRRRFSFGDDGEAPPGFGGGRGPSGASFTFEITAEGDDVLTYEIATALREEASERASAVLEPAATDASETAPVPEVLRTQEPTTPDPATPAELPTPQPLSSAKAAGSGSASGGGVGKSGPNARRAPESVPVDASLGNGDEPPASVVPAPLRSPVVPAPQTPVASPAPAKPTPAEQRRSKIRKFYRSRISPIGRVLAEELERLESEKRTFLREVPEALVMEERKEPRKTHVLLRGHYKNKGEEVTSGVPAVLPPLAESGTANRLDLALWLVSDSHPLTARVAVNRIWQQYFGSGIVRTSDDFGIRSELPSHPELIDWLAVEFRESGWDVKALHRTIVTSATYRQDCKVSPELLDRDPENRLLARGPRLRLSAEMVRDNALALSGLLVEKIGGPSVKPFQPAGLWKSVTGGRDYKRDRGESQYRRGLYVYWKRGAPYPSMVHFDASKRESCSVTRPLTTTPLQALTLLNDPVYVEASKMLGQRIRLEGGKDDAARLAWGFRHCTSRTASAEQLALLKKLLDDQKEHFAKEPEAAKKLLEVGDAAVDPKLDAAELAAWVSVANALLNLDAVIHRG